MAEDVLLNEKTKDPEEGIPASIVVTLQPDGTITWGVARTDISYHSAIAMLEIAKTQLTMTMIATQAAEKAQRVQEVTAPRILIPKR